MYLKSLEIQGFKSFPDKTVLQFGDDITAVVGPNGSGKSNISDAIRWVMGEQSTRALRGAKMEDVIFGGTQKRSAVGFAEATLVLDNSDGSLGVDAEEVAVTRRYYRSGESEYYINRRSARLRDINELFMDTGLGREGYSNISQGRIDEILALKSVDRREIFEEAAGISKFRHRKEETQRRLASTEDNLTRIGDKISELELQVEPLRVQAEKAKKYLAYKEELKGLEIAVWLESLERLSSAAQKAQEDYQSAAFILQQSHDLLEHLYQLADSLGETLHTQDQETDGYRLALSELQAQIREAEGAMAVLDGNIRNDEQNIDRIRDELSDATERSGTILNQIEGHDTRISQINESIAEINQKISTAQEQSRALAQNADALTQSYVEWTEKQNSIMESLSDKRAQCAAAESAEELSLRTAEEKAAQNTLALARLAEEKEKYAAHKKDWEEAKESVTSNSNIISGYTLRFEARSQKRDALKNICSQLEIEIQSAQSQKRMYEEMEREFEGYSKAVKFTMQQAKAGVLHGIHGPISSLIRTKDEYTVAVEIAMGAAMQYIVVSDERAGKAAIENLKRNDRGRNTFYPISTIRGKTISEPSLKDEPGVVGIASELVRFDPKYGEIIRHILGRTVIAESLDDALSVSKKYGRRFRLVTLDGQIVNTDSSMTGGSASRNAGILSRANAIARLQTQITEKSARLEERRKELESVQSDLSQVEYQLELARGELRQAEDAVLRLDGELRKHEVLMSAIQDALDSNEAELKANELRRRQDHDNAVALGAQIAMLEKELSRAGDQLSHISVRQNEAMTKVQTINDGITRCKVDAAALEAERQSALVAKERLQELSASMQGEQSQKEALMENLRQEITAYKARLAEQEEKKAALSRQAEETENSLHASAERRIATEASKTKAEREAQEKSKEILNLEREAARLEQKKNAAQLEEKQIVDKLWDNYGLTRSHAAAEASPIESVAGAQRSISDLKRKISALGEPNPGAIAQFELVNERYQYLCSQRDDVMQAKKELEGIIFAITDQMVDIFTTQFAQINTYFSQTFTEMFGGGKASLLLEDPDNPLECGIEIRVQPPGKQLKTITLLSGGEKAFVAIALYFAILKVRPTPFCMLDEIDAALDDRNVDRFAGYLRTLCKKTQFIVITHRRGTMEQADILYGVTMQEQGVSKIMHLDLKQMVQALGIIES